MAPSSQALKAGDRNVTVPTGLFINNDFVEAHEKATFGIENPATGEVIIEVQEGRAEDVDIAVKAARKTFKSREYKAITPVERAAYLLKLADLMEQHKEDLCALEMLDTGKTKKQAANLDVPGSIGTLRYYAGWADKILGQSSFNIPGTFSYTKREPVGVCGQIIPWKYVENSLFTSTFLIELTAFLSSCSPGKSLLPSPVEIPWSLRPLRPLP